MTQADRDTELRAQVDALLADNRVFGNSRAHLTRYASGISCICSARMKDF
jgi:hypothetical protein